VAYFWPRKPLEFCFCAFLIISIILILPRLETGFYQRWTKEVLFLDYESPPGPLEETDRMLVEVEKIIRHIPSGGL
jgi:multidrug efflux pump subunit AcrB